MKCSPFSSHNAAKLAREALDEIEKLISERAGAHRRDLVHGLIESRCFVWAVGTLPPESSAKVPGRRCCSMAKPKYG